MTLPRAMSTRRGFTLVEAIATMMILSIVGSSSIGIVWTAVHAFGKGAESLRLQSEASVAMERLTRELRSIPLDIDNTPDIQSLTVGSLVWRGGTESVELVGTDLMYTRAGVESVLCSAVTGFTLIGADNVNATLGATLSGTACDAIRRLTIEIELASGEATASVHTKVFLRCMALETSL